MPKRQMQFLPLNFHEAVRAGEFARIALLARGEQTIPRERAVVVNDIKLLAQTDCDPDAEAFVTSDTRLRATYDKIKEQLNLSFEFIDIHQSCEARLNTQTDLFDKSGVQS